MTVILLRHGRSTSNTAHTLAGRSLGVDLDDKGLEQADAVVDRIGELPIRALVSSPLLRCRRTLEPLAGKLGLEPVIDERLTEVDYGEWTGRKLSELFSESLWSVVQQQPSAAVFPVGGTCGGAVPRGLRCPRTRPAARGGDGGESSGWPAPTGTSSSPSSPTRWASIWTVSSASPPIRPR